MGSRSGGVNRGAKALTSDGPTPALRLEAASANILLFSALSTMPVQENNNA